MRKAAISTKGEWGQQHTKYPATSQFVGANDLTAGSQNYESTVEGILTKRKGGLVNNPDDVLAAPFKDQFEAIFSDGIRHLLAVQSGEIQYTTGDKTFNTVTNGTGFSATSNFEFATIRDKVYGCNGAQSPIVYDKQAVYGGAPANPAPRIDSMGPTAPTTAPTAAVGAAGNIAAGSYTYKITFVYYDLSESNGGLTSNIAAPGVSSQINLTSIPLGGHGVTSRKIYRDLNGDGTFLLVGSISDNTTTIYTDNLAVGGAFIPTDNNAPPTFGKILSFLDRAWIAELIAEPYTIRYSEVARADVFRDNNFIVCNEGDPITAITIYLDRIIVFNRQSMGQITGKTSDTFRYADIQGSVGCVDSRSIQVRTIRGVPTLIWLSDKGVYGYNGNSIEYLSDAIEDLINLNIQQAVRTKDKNTQVPSFTTVNPTSGFDNQTDWETVGAYGSLDNVATIDTFNAIRGVTGYFISPGFTDNGNLSNLETFATSIRIPLRTDLTGEDNTADDQDGRLVFGPGNTTATQWAQPITPANAGTFTSFTLNVHRDDEGVGSSTYKLKVWRDSAGVPGTEVGTSTTFTIPPDTIQTPTLNVSISVAAGERIWYGMETVFDIGPFPNQTVPTTSSGVIGSDEAYTGNGVSWEQGDYLGTNYLTSSYTFSQTQISASGSWISDTFDSQSTTPTPDRIEASNSQPASTEIEWILEAGNALDGNGDVVVETSETYLPYPVGGTQAVTISDKRYWRHRVILRTTDDRVSPVVTTPVSLFFETTGIWTSAVIDSTHSLVNPDTSTNTVLSFDSLISTITDVSGPTTLVEIRSSANSDMSSPSAWFADSSIGSVPIDRYIQLRITFTSDVGNANSDSVQDLTFNWTLQSVLEGTAIDTGISGGAAGWDLFQTEDNDNGGTILYEMRSDPIASTGVYYTTTAGDFPPATVPTEQFAQWRITLTSTANNVPTVEAVVVNWLITNIPSIRVASAFFNRSYLLAAAEFDQTTNNIVIVLDGEGKWRVWRGLNVNTLGLFFNDLHYGDATEGKLIRMFEGTKDKGTTNITFDVRSKAFDFSNEEQDLRYVKKVVKKLKVSGIGTGATYEFFYSVDGGATFNSFITDSGATTFTTTDDGQPFEVRLKAKHDLASSFSGRHIMWRILNSDDKEVKIEGVRLEALARKGEVSENV